MCTCIAAIEHGIRYDKYRIIGNSVDRRLFQSSFPFRSHFNAGIKRQSQKVWDTKHVSGLVSMNTN